MDDARDVVDPEGDEPADELAAARAALKRAQAAASEKGFRPGARPGRSRNRTGGKPSSTKRRAGRDPLLLGNNMKRLLEDRGWHIDIAAGAVMARWGEIVGPTMSTHVVPVAFEHGVLTVRADSTAWATQISLLSSTLLAQIETAVEADIVQELKVIGPASPSWTRGPRRVAGRGPRDTYG